MSVNEATVERAARMPAGGSRVLALPWEALAVAVLVLGGSAVAVLVRLSQLNVLGYNSDEAVYAGQGASIAETEEYEPFFPIFRAHPLVFQMILSIGWRLDGDELWGRLASAAFGFGTIYLVFRLGRLLYGPRAGLFAALLIALMPYHVLVSRQVLLDGPMTFFSVMTLYLIALFVTSGHRAWLYAAGGAMGLTILGKETSILLVGGAYAFFAMSPEVRVRVRDLALSAGLMFLVVLPFPLAIKLAGAPPSGENYLAYQLFRRPNHEWTFYPATVPLAIGPLVILLALAGLWVLRKHISWRETLLLCWIAVPALFFQLYPVKGFQYLLPIAPAVVLLAGRTLAHWRPTLRLGGRQLPAAALMLPLAALAAASIALPSWQRIQPSTSGTFLAGSGGVPGGRETGEWMAENVPVGAEVIAIGPSMANIIQYYGHRRSWGLSVGPNPLRRNPAYEPIPNPDLAIRTNQVQYLVWDAFSASRTSFFANKLLSYARRYHGRVVHSESVLVKTPSGEKVRKPVIVVYSVRR